MPNPTLSSYASVVQSTQGQAIPGATVTVLSGQVDTVTSNTQPGSPLATIYADPYGYSQVPQTALNLSGNVVINGTPNVSYSSGNQLSAYLAGNTITINGVQYTVASVNPTAGTLVLTTNAASSGTFAWSATIPITPLVSDGQGNFEFWAAPGYYVLQIYGIQITTQILQGIGVGGPGAFGTGFGNGSSGELMTTTLQGSGTGPADPTTVVQYEKVIIGATTYWRPLFQCILLALCLWVLFGGYAYGQKQINGNYQANGTFDRLVGASPTTANSCTLGTASAGCASSVYSGYSFNQNGTAAQGITYTLPTAQAGRMYCVANSNNGSAADTGVLTVSTSASGQFIIFTDGTLSNTGGNVTSGGAAADAACFVGIDSTHWQLFVQQGTWTKH